jgi:hypothetical protein
VKPGKRQFLLAVPVGSAATMASTVYTTVNTM